MINWLKTTKPNKKLLIKEIVFLITETICYFLLPYSFANIAYFVCEANITLGSLWASIHFLSNILLLITFKFKKANLKIFKTTISSNLKLFETKNNSSFIADSIIVLADYVYPLDQLFESILKTILILIISAVYSKFLSIAIFAFIVIKLIVSFLIQFYQVKKNTINIETNKTIDKILCLTFNFALIIILVIMFSNIEISLTTFLTLSTFINNYLSASFFGCDFFISYAKLKTNLLQFNKYKILK